MSAFFHKHVAGLLLLLAMGCQAMAQTAPEVTRGLSWLAAQVQADGTLANELQASASNGQSRAEVAQTLKLLASLPPALGNRLAAWQDDNTEFLARKVLSGSPDAAQALAALQLRQNADGGFGPELAWVSDPLDTAWALLALASAKSSNPAGIDLALNYLNQTRQSDGGYGVAEQTRIWISALVLLAADGWKSQYPVGPITTSVRDWLLGKASNGSYPDTASNAIALLALATQGSTGWQAAQTALKQSQQADGSWGGDVFATALAVRALGVVGNPSGNASTGDVQGSVVDVQTTVGLDAVSLQIVELPSFTTTSASNGSFSLRGIGPGQYTLRAVRQFYDAKQLSITISAGQVLTVAPIGLRSPSYATVAGVIKDQVGASLPGVQLSLGSNSVTTDANGRYQLTGIAPGSATISAAKASYQTSSALLNFSAGQTYIFSPILYAGGGTPPTPVLIGKVVDAVSGAVIPRATLTLSPSQAVGQTTTGDDGSFRFDVIFGTVSYVLQISAPNYQTLSVSSGLVNGVNDLGALKLSKTVIGNSISGVVTDVAGGQPLAGVALNIQGTTLSATSAANGSYQINGISAQNFRLLAQSAGYINGTLNVGLSQTGNSTVNVGLLRAQGGAIRFDTVAMSQPNYSPHDVIEVKATLTNGSSTAAASLVLNALISDAQGNVVLELKANAKGSGLVPPNLPLVFAPGSSTVIEMENILPTPNAGPYTAVVHAYDANGVVVAEGTTQFGINSEATLSGAVELDPPLTQAGAQTPIHITAKLDNLGNLPIPAGNAQLVVTLDHPGDSAEPARTIVKTWAKGSLLQSPYSLAVDNAGNVYAINKNASPNNILKITPQGQQSIFATFSGTLLDLIVDTQDQIWVLDATGSRAVQLNAQGGIVKQYNIGLLQSFQGFDIAANGDAFVSGRFGTESRLVRHTAQGAETILWRNGLVNPFGLAKDGQGNYLVTNNGDNTLIKISGSGTIIPFVSDLNRPKGLTVDSSGNIYVANNGDGTIVKISPEGVKSVYASGLNAPTDVKIAPDGALFVSVEADNAIYRISAENQVELFAKGIANSPEGIRYGRDGKLYLANGDGSLRVLDSQNQVSILATSLGSPRGLDISASGEVYVASNNNGTVAKVVGTVTTTFASGLNSPYGVAIDGSGNIHVTEMGQNTIRRYSPDGRLLDQLESALAAPAQVHVASDGKIWLLNNTFISVIEAGIARVLVRDFTANNIIPDPASGGLLARKGNNLYRISSSGVSTLIKSLPSDGYYNLTVDRDGNIYYTDPAALQIVKLDTSANSTVYASLPFVSRAITIDGNGVMYVLSEGGTRLFKIVAGNGIELPLGGQTLYGLTRSTDGRILYWGGANRITVLDPATGNSSTIPTPVGAVWYTLDGSNHGYLVLGHDLINFDMNGNRTGQISGFTNPKDIIWNGSELRFFDGSNRVYQYTPGSNPVAIATIAQAVYLAQRGSDLYFSNGGSVFKVTGTAYQQIFSTPASGFSGLAVRADGNISIADHASGRIITINSSNQVVSDFAALIAPQGLAFDGQGRLYVANYGGGTIARFEPGSKVANQFARVYNPEFLAFDNSGNLLVTRAQNNGSVDKIDPQGVLTNIHSGQTLLGVLSDASGLYALDSGAGQFLKFSGTGWDTFAIGLADPRATRVRADGAVYVLNGGNNTIIKLANGKLSAVAKNLGNIYALNRGRDANLYVAGVGYLYRIDPADAVSTIDVNAVTAASPFYGVAQQLDGSLLAAVPMGADSRLDQITLKPASPAPLPGTVVYQTSQAIGGIGVGAPQVNLDFGTWVPPYGGDFKFEVSYPNTHGTAQNYLHVGPAVLGSLSTATPRVGPGTQKIPLTLQVSGAETGFLSRVETSQVRRLGPQEQVKAMVSDRQGNLLYLDRNPALSSSALKKVSPTGVVSTVLSDVSGLDYYKFAGMTIDSRERIYILRYVSPKWMLIQVLPDGRINDLVTIDGFGPLTVNNQDEILIGLQGKLLKYNVESRQLSTITVLGVRQPTGLAVDGLDNIYVQNGGQISLIKPDGTSVTLFSKQDGIDDPYFETETLPVIGADCGENYYLMPSAWAKVGQRLSVDEEHTLVQLVARTGRISAVINTMQFDPTFSDVDYMFYDRLNSRILMWNEHGMPNTDMWQVPVTCGTIGSEVHLLSKPGQTLTGFALTPNASIPLPDGRTEYVWNLAGVNRNGTSFGFDTTLTGLKLGETRAALDGGWLSFKNSFSPADVKVALAIPQIQVDNQVNLGVASDKPEYGPGQNAQLATTLANPGVAEVGGQLQVTVFDEKNTVVANVVTQNVRLAANGNNTVNGLFGIGTAAPGTYKVIATLTNNGVLQASSSTSIKILADASQATVISTLALDKQQYQPGDTLAISSRTINQSSNQSLSGLSLAVSVKDPAGQVLYSKITQIAQLPANSSSNFSASYALGNAAPGTYSVSQSLYDVSGRTWDSHSVSFNVAATSDSGNGLSGSLATTPKQLRLGEAISFAFSVNNNGNSAISNLPLLVRVLNPANPANPAVLAEFPFSPSLAIGGSFAQNVNWTVASPTPPAATGSVYIVALLAQIGSNTLTLAQDNFTVSPAAVQSASLEVSQAPLAWQNVLVFSRCKRAADDLIGQCGAVPLPLENTASLLQCDADRAKALDSWLNGVGVAHKVTSLASEFLQGMRSGNYNTYWISNGATSVLELPVAELRGAVVRGNGLLVEGLSLGRNRQLVNCAGVTFNGLYPLADQTLSLLGNLFSPGSYRITDLPVQLKATSLARAEAQLGSSSDGIISAQLGSGKSLTFGFDWSNTLRNAAIADNARWLDVTQKSLAFLKPAASGGPDGRYYGGEIFTLSTRVRNTGAATTVQLLQTLPAGAKLIGTEPAANPASANSASWTIALPSASEVTLNLRLRAPAASGNASVASVIKLVKDGVASPYQNLSYDFSVQGNTDLLAQFSASVSALNPAGSTGQDARNVILAELGRTQQALVKGQTDQALRRLLLVQGRLGRIDGDGQLAAVLARLIAAVQAQGK
jgi:sugar lactone lactonase YvrE